MKKHRIVIRYRYVRFYVTFFYNTILSVHFILLSYNLFTDMHVTFKERKTNLR